MGLIKGIANVIKEKAKEELLEYIKKVMEEEKKGELEEKKEPLPQPEPVKAPEQPKVLEESPKIAPEPPKAQPETLPEEKKEEKKEEFISRIIEEEPLKINIDRKSDEIVINRKFASELQALSMEEFSLYMKLYLFVFSQKKNFGYLGNALRKKLELDDMSQDRFDSLIAKIEKRGLIKTDTVSLNQSTFILYLPFDEDTMKKAEEPKKKEEKIEAEPVKEETSSKKQAVKTKKPEKKDETEAEDEVDDSLQKQYKTFVAMEIDKAKMKVGRSNFDKIYMEAVKYIDKKYGFSVLSDSEKFKDYLTQYYISAFDILTFDEWKKNKEHTI